MILTGNYEFITALITTVGFPIFSCVAMGGLIFWMLKELNKTLNNLDNSIIRLNEKIDRMEEFHVES